MPIKNNLLFLVLLVIMSVNVFSLSISANDSIIQGQEWSFTANLDSMINGEEAIFSIDSEEILVLSKSNNGLAVFENSVSSKVSEKTISNNQITIKLSGLTIGTHTIKIVTDSDSATKEIEFYAPMSQDEKEVLQNDIDSLGDTIATLNYTINELKNTITVLENENTIKDDLIATLKIENNSLSKSIAMLESNINTLESEGKTNEEILMIVKDDLNVLLTEREEAMKNPLVGMFAFGSANSSLFFGILLLIVLVVVGVFIKQRSTSIYSTSLFSREDEINTPKEALLNGETKSSKIKNFFSKLNKPKEESLETGLKKKKWAVESYSPKEEPVQNKRFELGDLIKKE